MKKEKKSTADDILENAIMNDSDKSFQSTAYEYDYAGGSKRYIKESIVLDLIESLQSSPQGKEYPDMKKTGIELIAAERQEQIEKHGWTPEHDKSHENEELIRAAIYALDPCMLNYNQLDPGWAHFASKIDDKKKRVDQLKVAGALIAAQIDVIQATED